MKSRRPLGVTSKKENSKQPSKEEWRERAIFAETKLSSLASIPNDSWGWRSLRQREARKALRELLDAIEEE